MALYNAGNKYLFFHIFRTGGLSLRTTIDGEEILGGHVLARDVKKHFADQGRSAEWDSALKFVMVRNPFDWQVSTYQYILQAPAHDFHTLVSAMSLTEYLRWYGEKIREPRFYGTNAYASQSEFIDDDQGNQIVDMVLRFEELPDCIHQFRGKLGLPPAEMPHINITQRKPDYREYYDDESRELVERIFAEDLERFGYGFE